LLARRRIAGSHFEHRSHRSDGFRRQHHDRAGHQLFDRRRGIVDDQIGLRIVETAIGRTAPIDRCIAGDSDSGGGRVDQEQPEVAAVKPRRDDQHIGFAATEHQPLFTAQDMAGGGCHRRSRDQTGIGRP